jgi:hypothetical protein
MAHPENASHDTERDFGRPRKDGHSEVETDLTQEIMMMMMMTMIII